MKKLYILLAWPILISILLAFLINRGFITMEPLGLELTQIIVNTLIPLMWVFIFPQRPYKNRYRWIILGGFAMIFAFKLIPLNELLANLRIPIQEILMMISYGIVIYFYNLRVKFYPNYTDEDLQQNLKQKQYGFILYLITGLISVILGKILKSPDSTLIQLTSIVEGISLMVAGNGYFREVIHWHKHGENSELAARIDEIGMSSDEG